MSKPPQITKVDIKNPPPQNTCAGGPYFNDTIFFNELGPPTAQCQRNDKLGERVTAEDRPFYHVIGQGTLPNGRKYDFCVRPEDGYIKATSLQFSNDSTIMGSIKAQTTECPIIQNNTVTRVSQVSQVSQVNQVCELNNQVYDANIQTCVSCRDPSASAPIILKASDSKNTVNNNTILGGQYKCINAPIKTYDPNGNLLNQTCDSGETFNKDKMCETTFWAKK
jgi:hypothetical protein